MMRKKFCPLIFSRVRMAANTSANAKVRSQPFARIAPFLIFIIDSRARIVKHKNTKEKAQKEMTAQDSQSGGGHYFCNA